MKVVCICDDWFTYAGIIYPTKGTVYTIRGKYGDKYFKMMGYWFVELRNQPNIDGIEPSFDVNCFRPVTDISALTKLTKVKELEDA